MVMTEKQIQEILERAGIELDEAINTADAWNMTLEEYAAKLLTYQPNYIKAYPYPRYHIFWIVRPTGGDYSSTPFRILVRENAYTFYRPPHNFPINYSVVEVDNPSYKYFKTMDLSEVEASMKMTEREFLISELEKARFNKKMLARYPSLRDTEARLPDEISQQIKRLQQSTDDYLDMPRGWVFADNQIKDELKELPSRKVLDRIHYWNLVDIARKPENYVMPTTGRKIGIVGSRRRNSPADLKIVFDEFMKVYQPGDIIVSGGAYSGPDKFAKKFANYYNIPYIEHAANWYSLEVEGAVKGYTKTGNAFNLTAGKDRNALIARDSDILLSFPVTKQTQDENLALLYRQLDNARDEGYTKLENVLLEDIKQLENTMDKITLIDKGGTNTTIDFFEYNGKGESRVFSGRPTTTKEGALLPSYRGPKTELDINLPKRGTDLSTLSRNNTKKILKPLRSEMVEIPAIPEAFRYDLSPKPIGVNLRNMDYIELQNRQIVEDYFSKLKTDVVNISRPGGVSGKMDPMLGKMKYTSGPKPKYDTYIGRPSSWNGSIESLESLMPEQKGYFGNPFRLKDSANKLERQRVINQFNNYFYKRLERDPQYRAAIHNLRGQTLGCHCAPDACHGNVIQKYIDQLPPDEIPNYKVTMQKVLNDIDSPNARFFSINKMEERVINGKQLGEALDEIKRIKNLQGAGALFDPSSVSNWEKLGYRLDQADKLYLKGLNKVGQIIQKGSDLINSPFAYKGLLEGYEAIGRGGWKAFDWAATPARTGWRNLMEEGIETGTGKFLKNLAWGGQSTVGRLLGHGGGMAAGGLITILPELIAEAAYYHFSNPANQTNRIAYYNRGGNFGSWGDYVMKQALSAAGEKWNPEAGVAERYIHALGTAPRATAAGAMALPGYFLQKINYLDPAYSYGRTWMTDPDALRRMGLNEDEINQVMPYLAWQKGLQANWRMQGVPTEFRTLGVSAINPAWGSTPGITGLNPGAWVMANRADMPEASYGYTGVPF